MPRRALTLRRERLHELGAADLRAVAGGEITHGCTIYPTLADVKGCLAVHVQTLPRECLTGPYPTATCTTP